MDEPPPAKRSRWGEHEVEWDPEAELRDEARRAAEAERRANYRALEREEDRPVTDLLVLPDVDVSWQRQGSCRRPEFPTWLFFPARGDAVTLRKAKEVCARCPVTRECLNFALATASSGIWGGTSEKERRTMREAVA